MPNPTLIRRALAEGGTATLSDEQLAAALSVLVTKQALDYRRDLPVLDGDQTRREIADVLARLRFSSQPDATVAIVIDKHVRDYLIAALKG